MVEADSFRAGWRGRPSASKAQVAAYGLQRSRRYHAGGDSASPSSESGGSNVTD